MIFGKREEVNLTLPEIYHEPSLNTIVSGWAALHCRYQKARPLNYDLRGRIRLSISLRNFHLQHYILHRTSIPCLLSKLLLGTSKNRWKGWLVTHLKPEIFWSYRIGDAAWLRTCTASECKSFVLKTFFPCADFQRIWRLSSWSAFDLCRTSEAPSQPLGKDVRLYPLMPSWSYFYFSLVLCALLVACPIHIKVELFWKFWFQCWTVHFWFHDNLSQLIPGGLGWRWFWGRWPSSVRVKQCFNSLSLLC